MQLAGQPETRVKFGSAFALPAETMKLAVISDIHGNLVTLEAVLSDIRRKRADSIVCLGDVVATGPRPVECLETVKELSCPVIMGNTDERFIHGGKGFGRAGGKEVHMLEKMFEWTSSRLSASHLKFIGTFRPALSIDMPGGVSLLCYHGSPRSNRELITSSTSEEKMNEIFSGENNHHFYAGGHSHAQMLRTLGRSVVFNPGSVGLPFVKLPDGRAVNVPRGEYAMVEADQKGVRIEFCRVNVELKKIVDDGLSSGLPYSDVWASDWEGSDGFTKTAKKTNNGM